MARYLTDQEELLIELVQILAHGTELEYGLNLKEIRDWLIHPIAKKGGKNALQLLELEGESFIKEIRITLGETFE